MQIEKKITGVGAGALKYDILTALLVTSTCGDPVIARLSLRLSLLVTARFNWRRGTFNVGQTEMARMWGVTERTSKREIAQMRALGWVTIAVPAARGRVAQYRLELPKIMSDTRPFWDAVGPDFAARMTGTEPPSELPQSNVVPLHTATAPLPAEDATGWHLAAEQLRAQDPALYAAWFAPLVPTDLEAGVLILTAPNKFQADYVRRHHSHRILAAASTANRGVRDVMIEAGN